jgi:hypothetical protein
MPAGATGVGATGLGPTGVDAAGATSTPNVGMGQTPRMGETITEDYPAGQKYGAGQDMNIGTTGNTGLRNLGQMPLTTGYTPSSGYGNTGNTTGYDNNASSGLGNTGVTGTNNTDKPIPSSGYGTTGSAGVGNVADVAGPIPGYVENKAGGAGFTDPATGRVRDAGGYDGVGTVPFTNPRINPYGVDPNDADPYIGLDAAGKPDNNTASNTNTDGTQKKGVFGKIADALTGKKNNTNNDTDNTTSGATTGYDNTTGGYGSTATTGYDNTTAGYGSTGAIEKTPVQEVEANLPNKFENTPYNNAVNTYGTGATSGTTMPTATAYNNTPTTGYGNTPATGYDNTASGYGNNNMGSGLGDTNNDNLFERKPLDSAVNNRGATDSFNTSTPAGNTTTGTGYNQDPTGCQGVKDTGMQGDNDGVKFGNSNNMTPGQKLAARTPEDMAMGSAQQQRY